MLVFIYLKKISKMSIKVYTKNDQANGNFNNGEILEKKPIGFPNDGGELKPYSNIFYWAHAWTKSTKSTIGLHPHQGFEICSFVLKGKINHYDTEQKKWIALKKGDVQIIRSGSGISHAEELMEDTEIFQIWFDPNLSNTLKNRATYDDYKNDDFKKINSKNLIVKLIKNTDSKMKMEAEGITIKEYFFRKEIDCYTIKILDNYVHSIFIIEGSIKLNNESYPKGTFFKISNINEVSINVESDVKIFEITSPQKIKYQTYASTMI
tara:strand:- start:1031 stop:1825 length:795 start_codon:yes stop_codon:yes gene_type:complete